MIKFKYSLLKFFCVNIYFLIENDYNYANISVLTFLKSLW